MRDFIYEVRGTNDPVDGDRVVFTNREEAEDYASNFGNAEIYMVELAINDDNGIPTKVREFQIKGPEVNAIVNDPNIPNSCDADNSDNYDEFGNFRYPECDDDFSDIDEGCDDRRGHDPINRRERVNSELTEGFSEKLVRDVLRDAKDEYDRYRRNEAPETVEYSEPLEYFIGQSADSFGVPFNKWYIFLPDHISEDDAEFKAFKRGYQDNGGLVNESLDKNWNDEDGTYVITYKRWGDNQTYIRNAETSEESIEFMQKLRADSNTQEAILEFKDESNVDDPEYIEIDAFSKTYRGESLTEDDDMTDEEFVEALYNALTTKRVEAPFPEDKLDMNPPADDVPVVKCKITPIATHSEDEKPLNEVLYYDTEAGWKEPDHRTVDITYCREKIGNNDIIDISAGFSVTFTTRSGDSIYVEANLEEAHLKYNEDYEVQGNGDAAVVIIKKPLDKIFDLRSIVPNDIDLNDVELDSVISRIEDDSDLSYEELLDEQIEFFAKQLSLDKNIHNRVIELLENAIYNRTNFESDAIAVKKDLDIDSDIDESLEESDDSELKRLDSMINK